MFLRGMLPVCCCCFIVTALLFCALVGVEEAALVFKALELLPALLASAKRGDSKMCDTIVEKQPILAQVLLLSQDKNMQAVHYTFVSSDERLHSEMTLSNQVNEW